MNGRAAKDIRRQASGVANDIVDERLMPHAQAIKAALQAVKLHAAKLQEHAEAINTHGPAIESHVALLGRGFWGRMKWLLTGK